MKNYQNSDFAVNKFSRGIVYRFANDTVEISLDDFLKEHPEKSIEDFEEIKRISDALFKEQDRANNALANKCDSLAGKENSLLMASKSVEDEYEYKDDETNSITAEISAFSIVAQMLKRKKFTLIQEQRFILHFQKGLTYREIALMENVHFTAIERSIRECMERIRKEIGRQKK